VTNRPNEPRPSDGLDDDVASGGDPPAQSLLRANENDITKFHARAHSPNRAVFDDQAL
jgi:hypothetical protein